MLENEQNVTKMGPRKRRRCTVDEVSEDFLHTNEDSGDDPDELLKEEEFPDFFAGDELEADGEGAGDTTATDDSDSGGESDDLHGHSSPLPNQPRTPKSIVYNTDAAVDEYNYDVLELSKPHLCHTWTAKQQGLSTGWTRNLSSVEGKSNVTS